MGNCDKAHEICVFKEYDNIGWARISDVELNLAYKFLVIGNGRR